MSCMDIRSVRQVPLHADYNILEIREEDGGRDVIRDALLEQNRRVGRELWVCRKRCGKGGGIVVPWGMRNDVSCPSQSERRGRESGGEM